MRTRGANRIRPREMSVGRADLLLWEKQME